MLSSRSPDPEIARPTLWIRAESQREIVAAHLRHVRRIFRAAGWRVAGPRSVPVPPGAVAVLSDPWLYPLPPIAAALLGATGAETACRVPRLVGSVGEQTWRPEIGPYTLGEYERRAVRGVPRCRSSSDELSLGFAVVPGSDVASWSVDRWPPPEIDVVLVPAVRCYRFSDPADHERRELDAFVPQDAARLLDIGCGTGAFGRRQRGLGRHVVGVEPEWPLARQAARVLDLVLPLPIEHALPALRTTFDCVVLADVLEHLRDPGDVLESLHAFVAPDGCVVVSIPNSAWVPVLRDLASGRWDPTLAGVQARDHLTPMTPRSLRSLAAGCGFRIVQESPLPAPLRRGDRLWGRLASLLPGVSWSDLAAPQWVFSLAPA